MGVRSRRQDHKSKRRHPETRDTTAVLLSDGAETPLLMRQGIN